MDHYSEKQKLMLSAYVYLDISMGGANISDTIAQYRSADGSFSAGSVAAAGTGGGMDGEDVAELFTNMQAECETDPSFGELTASRKINDGGIRAVCYTGVGDTNPIVVFRGTGGTSEAWSDNMYGGFETSTRMQELASDFMKADCGIYKNVEVTGHSKGGNLAQYVTVKCPDTVTSCVSFDGQGFCEDFITENGAAIRTAGPKIKSVSAYNDFVNILLTSIAGEVIYVANEGTGVDAHSPLTMLCSCAYDEHGSIVSIKDQSIVSKQLKKMTDGLVKILDKVSVTDKTLLGSLTGHTIATVMQESSVTDKADSIAKRSLTVASLFTGEILDSAQIELFDDIKLSTTQLAVSTTTLKSAKMGYSNMRNQIQSLKNRTLETKDVQCCNIGSRMMTDLAIENAASKFEALSMKINSLTDALDGTIVAYESAETAVINMSCE